MRKNTPNGIIIKWKRLMFYDNDAWNDKFPKLFFRVLFFQFSLYAGPVTGLHTEIIQRARMWTDDG